MIQQEYTVRPPRGNAYRILVEVRDEPIVASRGSRSLHLDAAWVKTVAEDFLTRNKDYPGLVSYFSGFLKGLHTLGVIDVVETNPIPSEEKEADEPTPLWAAWQKVGV